MSASFCPWGVETSLTAENPFRFTANCQKPLSPMVHYVGFPPCYKVTINKCCQGDSDLIPDDHMSGTHCNFRNLWWIFARYYRKLGRIDALAAAVVTGGGRAIEWLFQDQLVAVPWATHPEQVLLSVTWHPFFSPMPFCIVGLGWIMNHDSQSQFNKTK